MDDHTSKSILVTIIELYKLKKKEWQHNVGGYWVGGIDLGGNGRGVR